MDRADRRAFSRLALPALAVALVGGLLSPAPAAPYRDELLVVGQAVAEKYVTFPDDPTREQARQLAALEKCLRVLDRASTSDEKDLALLAGAAKILDAAFPGDAVLGSALDAALGACRQRVVRERDRFSAYGMDHLRSNPFGARVVRAIGDSGACLDEADAAADRATRARLLARALKCVRGSWKWIFKVRRIEEISWGTFLSHLARGEMTISLDGVPFEAHACNAFRVRDAVLIEAVEVVDPDAGSYKYLGMVVLPFRGEGAYELGDTSGAPHVILELRGPGTKERYRSWSAGGPYVCTLNVTDRDEKRRFVEGTLSFTLVAEDPGAVPQEIRGTGGSFRIPLK